MIEISGARVHFTAQLYTMLSYVLSRSFCQAVAEVNRRSYPTLGSAFRAFTTSSPQCGGAPDSGKTYLLVSVQQRITLCAFGLRLHSEFQSAVFHNGIGLVVKSRFKSAICCYCKNVM